jgi:putative membrane protein
MGFVIRTLITAVALWIATLLVPGIDIRSQGTLAGVVTLLVVAVIFGLVNAFIKPIVKVVGCPLYVLTLGLFALVVNALLLMLTSWLAGLVHARFHVDGFWSAFWGAIVISVATFLISIIVPDGDRD